MSGTSAPLKICIVGDPGVGKTSILESLRKEGLTDETVSEDKLVRDFTVHGVYPCSVELTSRTFSLESGDPGSCLLDVSGLILVFDVSNPDTFESIQRWVDMLEVETGGDVPLVLIANKSDLPSNVTRDEILEVALALDSPCYFTNTESGENVNEAIHTLLELICEKGVIPQEGPISNNV
ncbi:MAG: Rab family GTPase [Candidatus Thorarchaeota archaeon]